jgi:hypothetical protein
VTDSGDTSRLVRWCKMRKKWGCTSSIQMRVRPDGASLQRARRPPPTLPASPRLVLWWKEDKKWNRARHGATASKVNFPSPGLSLSLPLFLYLSLSFTAWAGCRL